MLLLCDLVYRSIGSESMVHNRVEADRVIATHAFQAIESIHEQAHQEGTQTEIEHAAHNAQEAVFE